jgi:hypothetical protein
MRRTNSRMSFTEKINRNKPSIYQEDLILKIEGRNLMTPCFFQAFLKSEDKEWSPLGETEFCMSKTHAFLFSFKFTFSFEARQQLKILYVLEKEVVTEKLVLVSKILRMNQQRMDIRFNPSEKLKISKANQPVVGLILELGSNYNDYISFNVLANFENFSYFLPTIYFTIGQMDIDSLNKNKKFQMENGKYKKNIQNNKTWSLKSEKISGFEGIWSEENIEVRKLNGGARDKLLNFSFWSCNWVFADTLIGKINLQVTEIFSINLKSELRCLIC